ncbi:sigma 54-interacting transcriptional regulator, partial [Escherichia coli]|uniref:sigma 54-interacting transcriptional regulator n=1 Tax=Escherichia coli TaxID=562 RepID=UPI0013D630C4
SELFGYAPGAFTGALARGKRGLIEEADGGTLFLDEIGDMPLALQSRLLRVLAEREIVPVGGSRPRPVRVKVISASH